MSHSWTDDYKECDEVEALIAAWLFNEWKPAIVSDLQTHAETREDNLVWVEFVHPPPYGPVLCKENEIRKILIFPKFRLD